MENQHRKISGYRELSQDEINLMNEIKEKGKELSLLRDKLSEVVGWDSPPPPSAEETEPLAQSIRWLEIGSDHLQQGLMAWTRSVAKPEFF